MSAADAQRELLAYIPRLVSERLKDAHDLPPAAVIDERPAAVLWIDISGFTPLTVRLAQQGPRGTEMMTDILNRCFGDLGDRIVEHGGDLVDFAGDAILALWPADSESALAEATRRATSCALEIQSRHAEYPAHDGAVLRFYTAVGAGLVTLLHVGGANGRWKFIAAGPPLVQVALAMKECDVGDVVASREAWSLLAGGTGDALGSGFVRVTSLPAGSTAAADEVTMPLGEGATKALRAYILDSVLAKLDAGHQDWSAELRTVSVVFVTMADVDIGAHTERDRFIDAMADIHGIVDELDGTLHQVIVDDSGVVFLLAFGLPGHTHEDDARRAVQAALSGHSALAARGLAARAGVATGRVFCGSCGSASRRRYAMVGHAVNLAARLAAAGEGSVYCDDATRDASQNRIAFTPGPSLALKGMSAPTATSIASGLRAAAAAVGRAPAVVMGRERERQVLETAMRRMAGGEAGAFVMIEAEAGLGKSLLLAQMLVDAPAHGLSALLGEADAVEANTPYFAWRSVFARLLRFDPADDGELLRARLSAVVRDAGLREDLTPLVSAVLPIAIPETAATAGMTATDRGDATRALLLDLLMQQSGGRPFIVLDDLHWFDSASLRLLAAIRERMPSALIVGATRPLEPESAAARALGPVQGLVHLPLSHLSAREVAELVRVGIGAAEIPAALEDFIAARAGGHPLFAAELVRLLVELGIVRLTNSVVEFDADDPRLKSLAFPTRVEGLVSSRIDRLDPAQQLTLKVASVIGRAFAYRTVHDVHPIDDDRARLNALLEQLTRASLVDEDTPDPRLAYVFRHVVIRDVAYGLVAFAHRLELHRRVAASIEALPHAERVGQAPLLAHHYTLAEDYPRAIDALEQAGTDALRRGAGQEALYFFETALTLADAHAPSLGNAASPVRRANFKRQMGEAAFQLVDLSTSRRHLDDALERLGLLDRERTTPLGTALLRNAGIQLLHIMVPRWLRRNLPAQQREARLLAAAVYGTIAEQDVYLNHLTQVLLHSLMSVNNAETGGDFHAADRSYVTLAYALGPLRLMPLVRRYRARAASTTVGRNLAFLDLELAGRCVSRARWEEAITSGTEAAAKSRVYADKQGESLAWACVAGAATHTGRFDLALEAAAGMEQGGRPHYAMAIRATVARWCGGSREPLERFCALPTVDPAVRNAHKTYSASLAFESGNLGEALAHADEALALVEAVTLPIPFALSYLGMLPTIYTNIVRAGMFGSEGERISLIHRARRAARVLRRLAFIHPLGRPARLRVGAALASLEGRHWTARRLCRRARRTAEHLGMWPEVVLAELELARVGDGAHHLEAAEDIALARGFAGIAQTARALRATIAAGN